MKYQEFEDGKIVTREVPDSDYGFGDYQRLRTRVLAANHHTELATLSARITKFVQDESVNPVYAETLVNMLMAQALAVIERLTWDSPVYDLMAVRLITRNVRTTVKVWQRIMENNASSPEG